MSEACTLTKEKTECVIWDAKEPEMNEMIALPSNPSAFPNGLKELSESKVNILCGTPSMPCSG